MQERLDHLLTALRMHKMYIPTIRDITKAIDIAYRLWKTHKTNISKEYFDLAEDVHNLGRSLKELRRRVQAAADREIAAPPPLPSLSGHALVSDDELFNTIEDLTGQFTLTLEECETLLKRNSHAARSDSYARKLQWTLSVTHNITALRERISMHCLKISTVLEPLRLSLLEEIREALSRVENATDEIKAQIAALTDLVRSPVQSSNTEYPLLPATSHRRSTLPQIPTILKDKLEGAYCASANVPSNQAGESVVPPRVSLLGRSSRAGSILESSHVGTAVY